jgi:prepilin-type N-terminal cleavage/methylation domain-containing protein
LLYYLVICTRGVAYPLITFAYLPMAGYLFPTHRRLMEYWRPPRLPRIRPNQSGVTLIELLIEVAILAILIAGAAQLVSTTHSVLERQERRRRAVALAEDEIALLRARPTLPAVGVHPVEPELRKTYVFADDAQVEIRPGPTDRLREARVSVRPRGAARDPDIAVAAILPASAGPAAERRDVKGKTVSGRTHTPREAQP